MVILEHLRKEEMWIFPLIKGGVVQQASEHKAITLLITVAVITHKQVSGWLLLTFPHKWS